MELEKLKGLLGIPAADIEQNAVLQFVMSDVRETILNYCNLEELPEGLIYTAYRMAVDLYRNDRPGTGDAQLAVSSISEGDTSTSFTGTAQALQGSLLKNYQWQLDRYRRLRS